MSEIYPLYSNAQELNPTREIVLGLQYHTPPMGLAKAIICIVIFAAAKRWIGIYYMLDQSACGGGVHG